MTLTINDKIIVVDQCFTDKSDRYTINPGTIIQNIITSVLIEENILTSDKNDLNFILLIYLKIF